MNKVILLISICVFTINTYAQKKEKIKGDKIRTTITNNIDFGFNGLEVDDGLELKILQGEENSYTITTDSNLHDIIQFTVRDSVLNIYTTLKIIGSKKQEILVSFKNLDHITIKNDAKIESEEIIECNTMHLNAYDSSKFELDLKTEELKVKLQNNAGGKLKASSNNATIVMGDRADLNASINSSQTSIILTEYAQLNLTGDCDMLTSKLKDNADLNAKNMKASASDLSTSDNADAYVYVSKNFKFYGRGKSSVYLYGQPAIEIEGFTDETELIKK